MLYKDLIRIEDLDVRKNVPLLPLTSFRIGGPAHLLLLPRTLKALELTISYLGNRSIAYKILGQGSNLLVNDQGVKLVMSMAGLDRIHPSEKDGFDHETNTHTVSVEAGCRLTSLLSWCMHNGLSGLEGLSGIPAGVGGAVRMNAGTDNGSMSELIDAVLLAGPDGSQWVIRKHLEFDYRAFKIPGNAVISAARIRFSRNGPDEIRHRVREVIRRRRMSQPAGKPSAGCVFRNPQGDSAGRLIDACGLKGLRIGDAQVSKRHANFIINHGKTSAVQVLDLMEIIKERVREETGVRLVPELSVWGVEA